MLHVEPWQLPMTPDRLARLVAAAVAPAVGDLLHPGTVFTSALPYDDRRLPAARALQIAPLLDPEVLERLDAAVLDPPPEPVDARTAAVVVCTRDRRISCAGAWRPEQAGAAAGRAHRR
jgi:hypothetical protein